MKTKKQYIKIAERYSFSLRDEIAFASGKKYMQKGVISILLVLLCKLCIMRNGLGQQILIDQGIQVEGLWCFPIHNQPNVYKYLPTNVRLALDEQQLPKFSYMRYMMEKPGSNNLASISQANGGGILHFLVLYDTPGAQIKTAEQALREHLNNEEIQLMGPVIFDSGRYVLVSSILLPNGEQQKHLIGTGEAPILENSRIAFSFEVDPMRSKLLMESFKMATPDISLNFELSFSGLSGAYNAELTINWEEINKSHSFGAGGSFYFVGADVEANLQELTRNNAIQLKTFGENNVMDGLLNTVYNKLIGMLFEPVEAEKVPEKEKGSLSEAISSLFGSRGFLGQASTGFGLSAFYRCKDLQTSGNSVLKFQGRSTTQRKHFLTFNIGDLYTKYGKDKRFFKDIPLWDPSFQKREVFVGIDGKLEKEFNQMIQSVTINLKKEHQNGVITAKELVIDQQRFQDSLGRFSMQYLNQEDQDLLAWRHYDYQTIWKFNGGGSLSTKWLPDSTAMINLYTPFRRRKIELEGDLVILSEKGIKALSVKIEYPFFGETKQERQTIRLQDNLSKKCFEITLPNEVEEVEYTITWFKKDGTRQHRKGKDVYGLIFIDEGI